MLRMDLHDANRLAWNEATIAHNSHKQDQAGFLAQGGSTLFPEEIELLGDLAGQTLVHLQCNAGQDTLSLAHLGAIVTGVDISNAAIDFARRLSEDSGIPATFVRTDLYDWFAETAAGSQRFDVAFCSYGTLCWLSDLAGWAKGVAGVLRPGGRFVMVEFHPFSMVFESDWSHKYPYFAHGTVLTWDDGISDYVAASGEALAPSGYLTGIEGFKNPYPAHEFQWGIGDVVTAMLDAGLTLTALKEYPYANGDRLFERMIETPGRRMVPPADVPNVPLMYGIAARK